MMGAAARQVLSRRQANVLVSRALSDRVSALNEKLEALGIAPRIKATPEGIVMPKATPRVVREVLREHLLAYGVAVLAEIALTGEKESDRVAAVRAMLSVSVGSPSTLMDQEGNDVLPGVIELPALDAPLEQPIDENEIASEMVDGEVRSIQSIVEERRIARVAESAMQRLRRMLGHENGTNGDGDEG